MGYPKQPGQDADAHRSVTEKALALTKKNKELRAALAEAERERDELRLVASVDTDTLEMLRARVASLEEERDAKQRIIEKSQAWICPCEDGEPDPCPVCGADAETGGCGMQNPAIIAAREARKEADEARRYAEELAARALPENVARLEEENRGLREEREKWPADYIEGLQQAIDERNVAESALRSRCEAMVGALREHHRWHMDRGPEVIPTEKAGEVIEIDAAAEYVDSGLFERTERALASGGPAETEGERTLAAIQREEGVSYVEARKIQDTERSAPTETGAEEGA